MNLPKTIEALLKEQQPLANDIAQGKGYLDFEQAHIEHHVDSSLEYEMGYHDALQELLRLINNE